MGRGVFGGIGDKLEGDFEGAGKEEVTRTL